MLKLTSPEWLRVMFKDISYSLRKKDRSGLLWKLNYYFSNCTDEWYLSLSAKREGISGDFTPAYSLLDEDDVKKIYKLLPSIKIIFLIRNPIERAWSSFKFTKRNTSLKSINMSAFSQFIDNPGQELRSDYLRTLELYKRIFPNDQILVGFYDAISDQPFNLLYNIVDFLGGETKNIARQCNLKEKNNTSQKIDIPVEIESYLHSKYSDSIRIISEQLGSYSQSWLSKKYNYNRYSPVVYFS